MTWLEVIRLKFFHTYFLNVLAPQGIPMAPQDPSKNFNHANTTVNANYGAIEEPNRQDDAYDRYVSSNNPFK